MAVRPSALLLALLLLIPAAAFAAPMLNAVAQFNNYYNPLCNPPNCTAGETGIGVNPHTNAAFFINFFQVSRVTWNDASNPPTVGWTDVSPIGQVITFDPILYTNPDSGKTFVVQNILAGSQAFVTTDLPVVGGDGTISGARVWVPTQVPTTFPFFDHQTIGCGPHAIGSPLIPNIDPSSVTPTQLDGVVDACYYCAQLGYAQCARSDDDGLTWGPYVPINTFDTCGGLHGHVVVGRDGTAYVPNGNCGNPGAGGNGQGVHRSATNGLLWATSYIPGTVPERSDPVIAEDRAGTIWVAMSNGGKPMVSKSTDRGISYSVPVNVDTTGTIRNTEFPMMVAGDAGRVAMAYYGTTTAGDDQLSDFAGVWHLYVSISTDNGATWTQTDVTPTDPVQRGCIWLQGGNNACRNLLDFQGATVDTKGRILVGYADGCTSAACIAPTGVPGDSRASKGVIARLSHGPSLYTAFDPL